MPRIVVRVPILGQRVGDIITEDHKNYEVFKGWAERKNRRFNSEICEFLPEEEQQAVPDEDPSGEEEAAEEHGTCVCGYQSPTPAGLAAHKRHCKIANQQEG